MPSFVFKFLLLQLFALSSLAISDDKIEIPCQSLRPPEATTNGPGFCVSCDANSCTIHTEAKGAATPSHPTPEEAANQFVEILTRLKRARENAGIDEITRCEKEARDYWAQTFEYKVIEHPNFGFKEKWKGRISTILKGSIIFPALFGTVASVHFLGFSQ